MSKITFVFEYPDGQEPSIGAGLTYLGGKIVSASFTDLAEENDRLESEIENIKQELAKKY